MPTRFRSLVPAIVAVALAAAPAAVRAQQAPNLSGTWELDVAQSSFGMMQGPSKATMVIEHQDPALKITNTQVSARGERTLTSSFTTGGKESRNTGGMGGEVVSTLKWEGATLTSAAKTQIQGNDVSIAEKWAVSSDGKTLTINRTMQAPMMPEPMAMKLVYLKK